MYVSYLQLFLIKNQRLEGEEIDEGGGFPADLCTGFLHFFKGPYHAFNGFFVLDVDGWWGSEGGTEGTEGKDRKGCVECR